MADRAEGEIRVGDRVRMIGERDYWTTLYGPAIVLAIDNTLPGPDSWLRWSAWIRWDRGELGFKYLSVDQIDLEVVEPAANAPAAGSGQRREGEGA